MAEIKTTCVGKIIEGAMQGDLLKVESYANLIASDLEKQGEHRASQIIKNALKPKDNSKSVCVLDGLKAD